MVNSTTQKYAQVNYRRKFMSRNRLFEFGRPYLLTDLKEGVFFNEPAICVGKKDSDMERPSLCAVCVNLSVQPDTIPSS